MNTIANLLPILQKEFPSIRFQPGERFSWSPSKNVIFFTTHHAIAEQGVWSLLHELGHAQLGHVSYGSDFDLLKIESKAWQRAKSLGKKYGVLIDSNHIQDCLDTYRDWLHARSRCPRCSVVSLQRNDRKYQCFNCQAVWQVPRSQLCRSNRRTLIN